MSRLHVVLFLLLFVLSACKTTQSVVKVKANKERDAVLKRVKDNSLDYNWLETRAKIKYADDKNTISATGIFRLQKDSIFWGVIKKASIEGVRFKITPQLFELLDRQGNTYSVQPFDTLRNRLGINMTFSDLQKMFLGEPVKMEEERLVYKKEATTYHFITESNRLVFLEYVINAGDYTLQSFSGAKNGYQLDVSCEDIIELGTDKLPKTKEIIVTDPKDKNTTFRLTFTKIKKAEKLSVRFSVPASYKTIK